MTKRASKLFYLATFTILTFAPLTSAHGQESGWRMVNYWSEWCAPCRVEIPMFNELSVNLQGTGISIVGVNFDEDPREVTLDIAEDLGIEFPTLTQSEVDALALRPPNVMPTTYILTPDNEVAAKLIGMQTRESLIEELSKLGLTIDIN